MADAAEWRNRIETQEESGLSVADWCYANGISSKTFYKWRKDLKTARNETSSFIQLDSPSYLEIEIDKRVVIKLPSNFNLNHLKEVLEVFGC